MKKHLIAAAVAAAVAAPAMAQVEIYGIIDMGYSNQSTTINNVKTDTSGINRGVSGLSSSRLGFRGTEDLGGGLKASFVLESGLDTDVTSSTSGFFDNGIRGAHLTLSGGFGSVRFGRQDSLGKSMIDDYTAFGGGASFREGSVVKETAEGRPLTSATGAALLPSVDRATNGITYFSPKFNGVTVSASLIDATNDQDDRVGETKDKGYALKADYSAGGLTISAAYTNLEGDDEATETAPSTANQVIGTELKMTQVGARYALGAVNVFALYTKGEYTANSSTAKLNSDSLDVGVTYTIGATTLLASVGSGEVDVTTATKRDVDGHQLQARYALSKRTTAYVLYGKTESELAGGTKDKSDVTMVGVRHSF